MLNESSALIELSRMNLPAQPAFRQFIKILMTTFKLRKLLPGLRVIMSVIMTTDLVVDNLENTVSLIRMLLYYKK